MPSSGFVPATLPVQSEVLITSSVTSGGVSFVVSSLASRSVFSHVTFALLPTLPARMSSEVTVCSALTLISLFAAMLAIVAVCLSALTVYPVPA